MDSSDIVLLELLLVFGTVLGFGVYQLWSVRRSQRQDASRRQVPPS